MRIEYLATRAFLMFLGRVNIADRQLTDNQYPNAQIYRIEVTSNTPHPNGMEDVNELDHIEGIFDISPSSGYATVSETNWGEFGPVQVVDDAWNGPDVPFTWQPDANWIELSDAYNMMVGSGEGEIFRNVTLRQPINSQFYEPQYIFALADDRTQVAVGTTSGSVVAIN